MRKILCFLILACAVFSHSASQVESTVELRKPAAISDSLPWFAIREINESNSPFTRTFLARDAAKAERTALVFFATWCAPCKDGIKRLAKSQDELKANRINVVLVDIGVREGDEKKIRSWVKDLGAGSFKLVIDPFKVMTEGFGLVEKSGEIALPKTLVLDNAAKPLFLFGQEGRDWPRVIWEKK